MSDIGISDLTSAPFVAPEPVRPQPRPAGAALSGLLGSDSPFARATPRANQPATSGPIITRLPDARTAFANKYRTLAPALPAIPRPIRNSLIDYDLQRVNRGQNPLSADETRRVLATAISGKPATKKASPNPFTPGNLLRAGVNNIRQIGAAVPKLFIPNRGNPLWQELEALPTLPEEVGKALAAGDPGQVIARLTEAPGIRFVPGAYVAGNLAEGDFSELARNPAMTALDVLPAATQAAKATRVGKASVAAAEGTGATARPLRALATRTLDDAGELVPNRVGRRIAEAADLPIARPIVQTFGKDARALSRRWNRGNLELADWINPDGTPLDRLPADVRPIAEVARDSIRLQATRAREVYELPPQRVVELTKLAQTADNATLATLAPNELAFLDEARDLSDRYRRILVESGDLLEVGGEVYDLAAAGRLIQTGTRASNARASFHATWAPRLEPMRNNDPRVGLLLDELEAGDLAAANRRLNGLLRGKTRLGGTQKVGVSGQRADVSLAALKNLSNDLTDALKKETRAAAASRTIAPSRFQPLIQSEANATYARSLAAQAADPAQAAEITRLASERMYSLIPGWDRGMATQYVEDATRTWQALRDAGHNPMFVHRVAPSRAAMDLNFPRVHEKVPTPTQTKARGTLDLTAHVDDITVALDHQGLELLRELGSQQFLDDMIDTFGVHEDELLARYLTPARAAAEREPALDVLSHAAEMIQRDYSSVLASEWGKTFGGNAEKVWVPKSVARNLDMIHKGPSSTRLTAILDPIMKVFRTSLLPLSPRWHAYNILGGGVMVGTRTTPWAILQYGADARKMIRDGTLPDELRLMVGRSNQMQLEFNAAGGKSLRRLWDQVQDAKLGGQGIHAAGLKAAELGGKAIQKSFDFNAFFDDWYRAIGYLYGRSKAERNGAAKEVAEREGIALARKVMQNWDELTPIERNILRNVFPFYGFAQHIIRYVWNFPFDHPARAAIISTFARNELADLKGGMGELFLGAFQLGPMDDKGNVDTLNLAGWNPFADVANYGTLAGFLGSANPLISTVLQQAGVDPITGGPELYPEMVYDAATGRLTANTGNPLMNLAHNILPQSRAITALLGRNREFNDLLRTNPDAAKRALRSQIGLPSLTRTVNVPQEQFKAEIARGEAEDAAFAAALKSGDDSRANTYPGLRPLLAQVRAIQAAGLLSDYQPQTSIPNAQSALLESLRGTMGG